jgi:hypothetical protein
MGCAVYRVLRTEFFQCDGCRIECRVDSEELEPGLTPFVIMHCPKDRGIAIFGKVTNLSSENDGAAYGWTCGDGSTRLSGDMTDAEFWGV